MYIATIPIFININCIYTHRGEFLHSCMYITHKTKRTKMWSRTRSLSRWMHMHKHDKGDRCSMQMLLNGNYMFCPKISDHELTGSHW